MTERVRFRVIPSEDGMALRTMLARRLQRSPQAAGSLIRAGGVYVNKLRVRLANVRVATGERITVYPGADAVERLPASALRLVHREPGFCVIDKPCGIAAEFTRESCFGTLSDALLTLLRDEGVDRPYVGIVHPLDRRACGLVMFSTRGIRDPNLHRTLVELPIRRTYRMLVERGPAHARAVELALVERSDKHWRAPRDGETGVVDTLELAPRGHSRGGDGFGTGDLLETTLVGSGAGRIPLHARAAGHPLLGDEPNAPALALWCARMELSHPHTGAALRLEASPPAWAAPA